MTELVRSIRGDAIVSEVSSSPITLIDLWAPWCDPCIKQLEVMEKLAARVSSDVVLLKINVNDELSVAEMYGISTIPTVIVYRGLEIFEILSGRHSEEQLLEVITRARQPTHA
jgi:thioredoxin 1